MAHHTFPKGFKQYRVLKEIEDKNELCYIEIIKFAHKLSYGEGSFNSYNDRGYWVGIFQDEAWGTKLLTKNKHGKYSLNEDGVKVLKKLRLKFGDMTSNSAMEIQKKKHPGWGFERGKCVDLNEKYNPKKPYKEKRVLAFNERYADTLTSFNKRNEEKNKRMATKENSRESLRGFKPDDKVVFYNKITGESGETTVVQTTFISRLQEKMDYLILSNNTIKIFYHLKTDEFIDNLGDKIEIIKIK